LHEIAELMAFAGPFGQIAVSSCVRRDARILTASRFVIGTGGVEESSQRAVTSPAGHGVDETTVVTKCNQDALRIIVVTSTRLNGTGETWVKEPELPNMDRDVLQSWFLGSFLQTASGDAAWAVTLAGLGIVRHTNQQTRRNQTDLLRPRLTRSKEQEYGEK
jgi:hypothetical protein